MLGQDASPARVPGEREADGTAFFFFFLQNKINVTRQTETEGNRLSCLQKNGGAASISPAPIRSGSKQDTPGRLHPPGCRISPPNRFQSTITQHTRCLTPALNPEPKRFQMEGRINQRSWRTPGRENVQFKGGKNKPVGPCLGQQSFRIIRLDPPPTTNTAMFARPLRHLGRSDGRMNPLFPPPAECVRASRGDLIKQIKPRGLAHQEAPSSTTSICPLTKNHSKHLTRLHGGRFDQSAAEIPFKPPAEVNRAAPSILRRCNPSPSHPPFL